MCMCRQYVHSLRSQHHNKQAFATGYILERLSQPQPESQLLIFEVAVLVQLSQGSTAFN